MGTATTTITIFGSPKGIDYTQRNQIVRGTIKLNAGTVTTNSGIPMNWAVEQIKSLPATSTTGPFPIDVDVKSASNPPSGFVYVWDSVSGNLHIFVSSNGASGASGPLVEFDGALITPMLNDTIQFTAVFASN